MQIFVKEPQVSIGCTCFPHRPRPPIPRRCSSSETSNVRGMRSVAVIGQLQHVPLEEYAAMDDMGAHGARARLAQGCCAHVDAHHPAALFS